MEEEYYEPRFSTHLLDIKYALIQGGMISFYHPSSSDHSIVIKDPKRLEFPLSRPVPIEEILKAETTLRHDDLTRDMNHLLEQMVTKSFRDQGYESAFSASNVVRFLFEEFYPFMCGGEDLNSSSSLDKVIADRRKSLTSELAQNLKEFDMKLDEPEFVSSIYEQIRQRREAVQQRLDLVGNSLEEDLARMFPDCLIWRGHFFPIENGRGNAWVYANGERRHLNIDFSDSMDNEILSKHKMRDRFEDIVRYHLLHMIDDSLIKEAYAKGKYGPVVKKANTQVDDIGFEILQRKHGQTVFLYYRHAPFWMKDPRGDIYHPYPEKDIGIELDYQGGELKILGNLVRGPTNHYAVAARDDRLASMCNYHPRSKSMFDSEAAWVSSNLGLAIDMFTQGLTPENILKHGGSKVKMDYNGSGNMPSPVKYADIPKSPAPIITNLHEWRDA
ncbi:MAG: hypothetical protein ABIC95_00150 [archaeon]